MADTSELKSLGGKTDYKFTADSGLLESFPNPTGADKDNDMILVPFVMPNIEFTSLCPKTKQPDFARIEVLYVPDKKMVESKSLKLYFFSFRNHGAFHEECVNKIKEDLWDLLDPVYLRVIGDFTPRGGLAIKPLVQKYDCDEHAYTKIMGLVNQFDSKNLGI